MSVSKWAAVVSILVLSLIDSTSAQAVDLPPGFAEEVLVRNPDGVHGPFLIAQRIEVQTQLLNRAMRIVLETLASRRRT